MRQGLAKKMIEFEMDKKSRTGPVKNLSNSAVHEEHYVDNMIYYNYQKEKLRIYNKRRLQHWMSVFTNITQTISFPSIMGLVDRE